MRRGLLSGLMLGATLAGCGSSSGSSSSSTAAGAGAGHTLQFGAGVSSSGAGAIYGPSQINGINLAVDEVNSSGGVNGATLAFDIEDDASLKAQSAQQFQALIAQKKVLGLLGPTLSNSAVAAHPVADAAKTPVIAISNTGIGLVGSCPYDCGYIFRDSLGEATAIPANVREAVSQHSPRTAVIMYANDDKFSSDGETIFKSALAAQHVQLVDEVPFSKNETTFDSFVTKMRGDNPDLLVVSTLGGVASKVMIEARKQGYAGPILGGNGFNTGQVSNDAGDAGKGAQSASAYYVGTTNQANVDFVDAYTRRYHKAPDQIAAQAYTGVLLFAAAARRATLTYTNTAADRQAIRDALVGIKLDDSPLGTFAFTAAHDVSQPVYIVALDGRGGFTLVDTVKPS